MNLSEFRDGRVHVRNSVMKGLRENESCEKEKAILLSRCFEIQIYWIFSEKKKKKRNTKNTPFDFSYKLQIFQEISKECSNLVFVKFCSNYN